MNPTLHYKVQIPPSVSLSLALHQTEFDEMKKTYEIKQTVGPQMLRARPTPRGAAVRLINCESARD